MRPLAVLILVLGAIASLFFAFTSLTRGERETGTTARPGLVVRPAIDEPLATPDPLQTPPALATPLGASSSRTAAVEVAGEASAHTGHLRGSVLDGAGEPVEGALVQLGRAEPGAAFLGQNLSLLGRPGTRPLREQRTGPDGAFSFRSLEPGPDWTLYVEHPDYAPTSAGPIEVPPSGGVEERIVLDQGNVVRGRVVAAATGQPVAGAVLTLDSPLASLLPSTREGGGELRTRSDDDGRFTLAKITPGQKTLVVEADGFATLVDTNFTSFALGQSAQIAPAGMFGAGNAGEGFLTPELQEAMRSLGAVEEGPDQERLIQLAPEALIEGITRTADGEPLEGVELVAVHQFGRFGSRGRAESASDGRFSMRGLGSGAYTLTANLPGYQATPLQRVQAGGPDVDVVMAEQGGVRGRVVDARTGRPVSQFTCRVRMHHPNNVSWGSVVARRNFRDREDGSFSFQGVPSGTYVVEAIAKGFASSFSDSFEVSEGVQTERVTVQLTRGGSSRGLVLDAVSGEPIQGALVTTHDNNYVESGFMGMLQTMGRSATSKLEARTGADGTFVFELMTPDVYQIRVQKPDYSTYIANGIRVGDGVETPLPTIELRRGATVSGIVYDEGGATIPGATVMLNPADRALSWDRRQARTDAHGAYTFRNVPAGGYELSASRPPAPDANPFSTIIDMRNSQRTVTVGDGARHSFDLRFKAKSP